ncbi:MAG: ABC transporter substrate-binding protein [Velocimicrobium sp.]
MKKKSLLSRGIALTMMATMVCSLFTGCGSKSVSNEVKMDKDHVYHADYYDLPEGMTNINTMKVVNDRIYIDGYNETNNYTYEVCSMNADGSDVKVIFKQDDKGQDSNISNFAIDQEGNLYFFKSQYITDDSDPENIQSSSKYSLVKVDGEGKELLSVELKEKEDFYPSSMLVDGKGNIFLLANESLEIYDKDGKQLNSIDTSNSYVDSAFLTQGGNVMLTQYTQDYSSKEVKEYDEQTKKFSDPITIGENLNNYTFYQATGYDLFMKDSTDLYGFDMTSGEKTKLVNWIDSDINGSYVNYISGLSDGKLVCVTNNYMKNTSELAVLTKVEPKDVVDKTVLTLATVYDMDLSPVIIEFNKKSEKYRITLKDYSVYNTDDDYTAGSQKLNTDIISGDVPDILCVNDASSFEGFSSKGLFLDFNELIEKDETFNKSDYLENIFQAFESNGKLYSMVPSFYVFTILAKTSDVGSEMGWTMDDMDALVASKPKGTKIMTDTIKSTILSYGNYMCMDEYVDWEKGTCNFDNPEFIRLLEFANEFPESYDDNGEGGKYSETRSDEDGDLAYRTGKTLLMINNVSDFSEFHRIQKATFGEDVTFVGFPNASKNGSAISPMLQLAISSKSSSKDAAWEFVKTFFEDDYQNSNSYLWPVKLSAIEKKKEEAQKVETYTDENGKEVPYDETYTVNGKEEKLGTVTDEECEKVMTFLKSLNQVMRYDEKIYTIMDEETGAYFAGQKSAEETAKLVQNRVNTYLNEIQ